MSDFDLVKRPMEKSWNAAMRSMIFLFCAFVAMTATAKEKTVVWHQPATAYGNCYGDGFFNLVLDVTKVELKDTETVVYITAQQRSDYSSKDTRTGFVDNGYQTDTVTVVGWLKDMPEHYKQKKTFSFGYQDLYTDKQKHAYADLDEQGRFTAKIPVLNSSEFFCDWERCFIRTMFEPGKTYFMLYDFKEGRRYFMGDDCRLQNELFRFPLDWNSISLYEGIETAGKGAEELFEPYIASVDSSLHAQFTYINALCQQYPTLSTRFNMFRKGNLKTLPACYSN